MEIHHGFGVDRVLGFRFGFAGLDPASGYEPIGLDPAMVRDIHMRAGTVLGTSRGPRDPSGIAGERRRSFCVSSARSIQG
ncbi:MAG: 6-phosphofructokinase [Labilithrix sp.]|nr:6-phosphofructokinase [Labilithrix sp.]